MPLFEAAAWFSEPVDGRPKRSTMEGGMSETVEAETPEAAARKWLWRLSEAEREATVRILVWAPKRYPNLPLYRGAEVRFRREDGRLIRIEDPAPP